MALSVSYTHFDGELVYQNRGGAEHFYVPDSLGSTVAMTDAAGATTDTFTYWPYGEVASKTGTTSSPFTYLGLIGYYTDALNRLYVRARYYLRYYALWLTLDPLWPDQSPHGYASGQPTTMVDSTGRGADHDTCAGMIDKKAYDDFKKCLKDKKCSTKVGKARTKCIAGCAGTSEALAEAGCCYQFSQQINANGYSKNPCFGDPNVPSTACCEMRECTCLVKGYQSGRWSKLNWWIFRCLPDSAMAQCILETQDSGCGPNFVGITVDPPTQDNY